MFYGIGEALCNVVSLVYTKLWWGTDKRLIRLPFRAHNKKNISLGEHFTCGYSCRITAGSDSHGEVRIGRNFSMGDYCQIEGGGGIEIGDDVLFASKVFISSNSHGLYNTDGDYPQSNSGFPSTPDVPPVARPVIKKSVTIGNNVWIGNGAMVLMGVKIGSGSIIGAGTVVTKDVPSNVIVAGNPARVIREYYSEKGTWEKVKK